MSELQLAMAVLEYCNSIEHWVAEHNSTADPLYRETCKDIAGDEWVKMVNAFLELQKVTDRMAILPLVINTTKAQDKIVPLLNLVMPTE